MDMKLGASFEYDQDLTNKIIELAEKRPLSEVFQAFPAYTKRQLITRFLAYYELFKMIQDVPGWIAECGIYHGFSFFSLGKFLEIFCMGDKTRKIVGFDNFRGFTELAQSDGLPDLSCTRHEGGTNPSDFRDEFFQLLSCANADCFAPWAERFLVVEGDARETIPKFCIDNPGLRLSMLHIDIDIYEPVKTALANLYPRLLPGGIVVLDEFAHVDWPGESQALTDVFIENGWPIPKLQSFPWIGTPTTYFIKEHF
jgi:hypothetical protein